MFDFLEYPVFQPDEVPGCKENRCHDLPDIRRQIEVMAQACDDPQVDEIIHAHKDHKPGNLAARLALASFVVEYPLFIHDEKQRMRQDTRCCQRNQLRPFQ